MQPPTFERFRALCRELAGAAAGDSVPLLAQKAWITGVARYRLRACTQVGAFPLLSGRPVVFNRGELLLGDRVVLRSDISPIELQVLEGGRLEIGDRTFINYGTSISATGSVVIGRDCLIGMYSIIFDNQFHAIDDRHRRPPAQPVVLEDNVWLGHRALVLPGVTIGHDSVIGAGSVVTRSVPPRSVAVGNPARVIRTF